jgi:hypothetical protein
MFEKLPSSDEWIRVFRIEPVLHSSGQIRCEMKAVKLKEKPIYSALSYTWGSAEDGQEVLLNGEPIYMRSNLCQFLRVLQSCQVPGSGDWLWADAICINQADVEERGQQVASMGKIYRGASQMFAWLGEDEDNVAEVFRSLNAWSPESSTSGPGHFSHLLARDIYWKGVVEALKNVRDRPYWTRTWIVQEILLAPDVIVFCGESSVSWKRLMDLFSAKKSLDLPFEFDGRPFQLEQMRKNNSSSKNGKPEEGIDLLDLVSLVSETNCSDPHDKIYGVLSLSTPSVSSSFTVDYSEQLGSLFWRTLASSMKEVLAIEDWEMIETLRLALDLSWHDLYKIAHGSNTAKSSCLKLETMRMSLFFSGTVVKVKKFHHVQIRNAWSFKFVAESNVCSSDNNVTESFSSTGSRGDEEFGLTTVRLKRGDLVYRFKLSRIFMIFRPSPAGTRPVPVGGAICSRKSQRHLVRVSKHFRSEITEDTTQDLNRCSVSLTPCEVALLAPSIGKDQGIWEELLFERYFEARESVPSETPPGGWQFEVLPW